MPRPPGPGFTLLTLFLLPSLLVAAQQQQHDAHQRVPSPPPRVQQARAMPAPPPPPPPGPDRPYTPILAQNERALATKVSSAPAVKAVRARPGAGAASGVLAPSARLLRDWEVEDFVLLATVDGHIHARDRYDGRVIWELPGTPMLQTIYNSSEDRASLRDQAFVWIVEPREDGALYVLTPGPYPALQSLGLTVKQLTDLAPYASDDPDLPVVYNVEKRTFMLNIDAATGLVKQSFSPSGMFGRNDDSCASPVRNYFRERDCRGTFEIGQTEYIISIHNKKTNEHVCTIKYAEWTSNKRDTDLKAQYTKTMDNHYIHGKYDGRFAAYDYRRPRPFQRPLFEESLPYPVARVFDVARPSGDESDNAPLVLLPQPAGPQSDESRVNRVLLNTTETGAWYALSEMNYPTITDGAPQAACYNRDDLLTLDEHYSLPADEKTLIGVHEMDRFEAPSRFRTIAAPTEYRNENGQVISIPPDPSPREVHTIDPPPVTYTQAIPHISPPTLVFLVIFLCLIISWAKWMDGPGKLAPFWSYLSEKLHAQSFTAHSHVPATLEPEKPRTEQVVHEAPTDTAPVAAEISPENAIDEPGLDLPAGLESKEKKVTFDIPYERSDDLTPLSRTTTAEQGSPDNSEEDPFAVTSNAAVSPLNDGAESTPQDPMAPQTTPKKKKSHRGKRGGRKLSMRQQKDDDEVGRIVDAAKQLDPSPSLHPDEITMNGDDMQDVTNIKRIGKLTIDQDRLLGNGSGGTFVFEGKWNERDVAIKRMLPQYFGLAEQEVRLLQESDLHPNVIRYFDDEKDENFLYIAVELCQASLFDLYKDGRPGEDLTDTQHKLAIEISRNVPRVLYQLAYGLNHLHSLRIIHRDIKPQNILIAYPSRNRPNTPRLVISDFGLCKTLPDNVSTLIGTTGNAGTVGWKAPELISQPKELSNGSSTGASRDSSTSTDPVAQGVKRAVDIFSLGCVFFYVLTNGCHPFDDDEGWMQIREYNIKKEKVNLNQLRLGADSEEPYHLIQWMLKTRPEDRPTAVQVMNHPFFWSAEKRLNFLCDCSDHWERELREPPSDHLQALEDYSHDVLDHKRNFLGKLDHAFINSLGKQRKYTGDRMLDLLRALRNKKNHYEDMDESVKAKVGPLPEGYLGYWTVKFPRLLMSCYQCVWDCRLEGESRFKPYFEGQTF